MTPSPDNQLENVLADLIKKMGDAAQHYGPQALNLAGEYLQINAIISILVDVVMYGVLAVSFILLWRLTSRTRKEFKKDILAQDDFLMIGGTVLGVAGAIALLAVTIGVTIDFLSPDTWIAAFSPQLALVHQAMQAVSK